MAKKLDVTTGKAVNYEYDSLGRLIHSYQTDNGTIQQHTEHLYDTENRLVRQSWTSGGTSHVMDFVYDNTGKPYALKLLCAEPSGRCDCDCYHLGRGLWHLYL